MRSTRAKRSSLTQTEEDIASQAVAEIQLLSAKATIVQSWFRSMLHRKFFSRRFKTGIARMQSFVRARAIRKRYLALVDARRPWSYMLRPNEAIVLSSLVTKSSDVRGLRAMTKNTRLKSFVRSKKTRQLIMTTGESGSEDSALAPRIFYADPSTRTWKGEIPYDVAVTSVLTLDDDEFVMFSRPNEDKMDKDPVWSFEVMDGTAAIEWVGLVRRPQSVLEMVENGFPVFPPTDPVHRDSGSRKTKIDRKDSFLNLLTAGSSVMTSRLLTVPHRTLTLAKVTMEGPLLMRELTGPKKYFQRQFCLMDKTLLWSKPGEKELVCGLSLTSTCKVRILTTPRHIANLPDVALWVYVPMRAKPIKFRTLDLAQAQRWAEAIGFAIAECAEELSSSETTSDVSTLRKASLLLDEGRDFIDARSFLSAKIKFKEALDACVLARQARSSDMPMEDIDQIEFACLELRAKSNFVLGLFEKSLEDVSKALVLAPEDETSLRIRAACYERLERFKESLAEYERLVAEFPLTCEDLVEHRDRLRVLIESRAANKRIPSGTSSIVKKRPAIARQNSDASATKIVDFPSSPSSTAPVGLFVKRKSVSNLARSVSSPPTTPDANDRPELLRRFSSRLSSPASALSSSPQSPLRKSAVNDESSMSLSARAEMAMAKRLSLRMADIYQSQDSAS